MKTVTRYQADDGSLWADEAKARERDDLSRAVALAMAPLGPLFKNESGCDFANGLGYVRHDPGTVRAVKGALILLSHPVIGYWLDEQAAKGVDLLAVHPSWFCRVIDHYSDPLAKAWSRLWCIDEQGREWGQPYYADHPGEAESHDVVRVGAGS